MSMRLVLPALAAAIAFPTETPAQSTGQGFMFKPPIGSIVLRGGFSMPIARSEIFSFTIDQLTHDRSDFNSWTAGADLAFWVRPRWDFVISGLYAGENKLTEFRRWVDNNNLPITQRTTFQRVPVIVGLRYYLQSRGRSIGRFSWVPERLTTYVGGGLGATWYRFYQAGDFVDFTTLRVFADQFESTGLGLTAGVFAGGEWALSHLFSLSSEVRYTLGFDGMSSDFVDFDPIDLSGVYATVGLVIRLGRWPRWSDLH